MPPTSPPAASQGRSTVLHQPRSARTAAAKQLRTSHRGAAALLSAAAAAGQPGPRRAPRPVSPGTAALAADVRGARRPANALNELRPLRQRVSRAAGICLPAATGCQRSSARCCRQSAARCRWPPPTTAPSQAAAGKCVVEGGKVARRRRNLGAAGETLAEMHGSWPIFPAFWAPYLPLC